MATTKSIVLFGDTGSTGRQVVEQDLLAGFQVTVVVRSPAAFPVQHLCLTVAAGDVPAQLTFESTGPGHKLSTNFSGATLGL